MSVPALNAFRHTAVAAIAAAALLAGSSATAADPGITSDTIRIGMFAPMTGSMAVGSLTLLGATAIYKSVNDAGGINGRKIELVVEDDGCDPNKTIAAVKKLMSQDNVFMIHGGWCSGTALAAKPEFERAPGFPWMILGAASAAITKPTLPNVFQPIATTDTVAKAMVDFALSKPNTKRVAIISHSDEWGKSHLEPLLANLKKAGIEPVETAYLERGSADATSPLLRIRNAKPDCVLAVLYAPELTLYVRDAFKYNLKVPIVTTQGVSAEDMVKRVGNPAATSEMFVFYPLNSTLDAPGMQKWVEMFKKYNPSAPVETLSFLGSTGTLAVVEALKKAGPDLTRAKVIAEFNKITNFNPGISSGSLTFTPEVHAGISTGKMVYMPTGEKPVIVDKYPAKP